MKIKLDEKKCVQRIGVNSMNRVEINKYLKLLNNKWEVVDDKKSAMLLSLKHLRKR